MKKDESKTGKLATPAKDEQKKKDKKWKIQDESDDKSHDPDDKSHDRLKLESEISNASQNQKRKDSQQGHESKIPESHRKQTEKDWRTDKKLPPTKM